MNTQSQTNPPSDMISLIADCTMRAYIRIAREKGVTVDCDKACESMRVVLKAEISGYMDEWRAALDAHLSESWLKEMINTQAISAALKAMKMDGLIS